MSSYDNLSKDDLIILLNKCWMTHDGMWFFHCAREFGMETANRMNKAAIKSLAPFEISRMKKALGFENETISSFSDFKLFMEGASYLVIPPFMNIGFRFTDDCNLEWEFEKEKCFAYVGIKRAGAISEYQCGVIYRIKCWLENLDLNFRVEPDPGGCLMHEYGSCSGRFMLEFN